MVDRQRRRVVRDVRGGTLLTICLDVGHDHAAGTARSRLNYSRRESAAKHPRAAFTKLPLRPRIATRLCDVWDTGKHRRKIKRRRRFITNADRVGRRG